MLIVYWITMYALTHWPRIDDLMPRVWMFPNADKLVHASMFAGWGTLWWWLLSKSRGNVSRAACNWLVVGAAAYAAFDEVTQAIVSRTPDILDFACDMAGVLAALTLFQVWQNRRLRGSEALAPMKAS